jgi:hypothetical protein
VGWGRECYLSLWRESVIFPLGTGVLSFFVEGECYFPFGGGKGSYSLFVLSFFPCGEGTGFPFGRVLVPFSL